ncbi:MAG: cytochrome b N-terminal domain-containing protein [Candidatus Magnetominusculus sp. LBB02]|nr:cytochrome b N-terminal domain-containing protein [Candidatus Magnetominusculus sp. LBB02]
MNETSGVSKFIENVKSLADSVTGSIFRGGKPDTDKARASVVYNNFFMHIQSVKTHVNTLRPSYTLGLGLIVFFLFAFVFTSGIFLMVYYNPSIENAFRSVKNINHVVFAGKVIRNVHKWTGEGMIVFLFLHMARVFFTGSYKSGREFNWLVGIVLLILTFMLNLSGYLLPWDQLSYWAMVIVSNIMMSPKELTDSLGITKFLDVGTMTTDFVFAGLTPGKEALNRVYLFHVMLFPIAISIFVGIHFWRIRKDGGMTRPEEFTPKDSDKSYAPMSDKVGGIFPTHKTYGLMELATGKTRAVDRDVENTVMSWPNLLIAELAVLMFTLAFALIYSYYVDAPLKEMANPLIPENPAKAPWYFLGLQELLSYSAFMGGVGLPTAALIGLALIPYLDREQDKVGVWFTNKMGKRIALESFIISIICIIGMLVFAIKFGWLRSWFPDIPQLVITIVNPGSIWVAFMILWSLFTIKRTGSTRMGAMALFVMFLVSYVILTYFATEMRGPNWGFYWSKSQWPIH